MSVTKLAIFALLCGVAMGHMGMSAQDDDYAVGEARLESGSGSGSGSGLDKLDTGVASSGKKGKKGSAKSPSYKKGSPSAKSSKSKKSKSSKSGRLASALGSSKASAGIAVGVVGMVAAVAVITYRRQRMTGYTKVTPAPSLYEQATLVGATEKTPLVV